jgi:hypothetical protein
MSDVTTLTTRPGLVSDFLATVARMPEAEAVAALVEWKHPSLIAFLRTIPGVDDSLSWNVAARPGQYQPANYDDGSTIYDIARLLFVWTDGPNHISPLAEDIDKRRRHFTNALSGMVKAEADALAAVSRGINPWPGLTVSVIHLAFPELASPAVNDVRANSAHNATQAINEAAREYATIKTEMDQQIGHYQQRILDCQLRVAQARDRLAKAQGDMFAQGALR